MDISNALHLLSLDPDTPFEQALEHYRRLVMQHHPDRGGDNDTFIQIRQAWQYWKEHRPLKNIQTRGSHDILLHVHLSLEEMLYGSEQREFIFFREHEGNVLMSQYTTTFPPVKPGARFVENGLGHIRDDGTAGSLIIICHVQLPAYFQMTQEGQLLFPVPMTWRHMKHGKKITLPSPFGKKYSIPPQRMTTEPYVLPIQPEGVPQHLSYGLILVPPDKPERSFMDTLRHWILNKDSKKD